jgi:hypothetical protein
MKIHFSAESINKAVMKMTQAFIGGFIPKGLKPLASP